MLRTPERRKPQEHNYLQEEVRRLTWELILQRDRVFEVRRRDPNADDDHTSNYSWVAVLYPAGVNRGDVYNGKYVFEDGVVYRELNHEAVGLIHEIAFPDEVMNNLRKVRWLAKSGLSLPF